MTRGVPLAHQADCKMKQKKSWQGWRKIRTLRRCWWDVKQCSYCGNWQFLNKLKIEFHPPQKKIEFPYDPAVPLLGISVCVHAQLTSRVQFLACQAPLSIEFSRQEYQSGLLFPTAGCRGPASAESRGYPQDERRRRERERRHVRPALIGPNLCFTFDSPFYTLSQNVFKVQHAYS